MKRYLLISIFFILSTSFVFSQKVVAAISSLKGAVMVKPFGSRKYIPAYKGQMLKSSEWIKTKDNVFVAIVFLDGSNIKIKQKTEVQITSYRQTSKELKTTLNLTKGQAWSNVASQGDAGEFTIKTPSAVASVKGTEFDLEYNAENDESTLTVFSGEVLFAGELGEILAGAMEASKNGGAPKKVTQEELPSWQQSTDPKWAFKLKPDRMGKQQVGTEIKVAIQMLKSKSKKFDDSFEGAVTISSQTSDLLISGDGSSWGSDAEIPISKGRGSIVVKSGKQGQAEIIIEAADSESNKMSFEYYQSKSQKKQAQAKLASLATKGGNAEVNDAIQDKELVGAAVSSGSGSIDDILQKLDTGELEGELVLITNSDGTVTVKLTAKPRAK